MKALVTGGAGFIGSNIVRHLLDQGDTVSILDDYSSGHRANVEGLEETHMVEGSVTRSDDVDRVVSDNEVIFHLAASVGNKRAIEHPRLDSTINILGTLNVLEACRRHDVARIVYSSSAGVLGELQEMPITESHPLAPDTPYGVSKLAGELHCLAYAKMYGINAVCLRYFNVYGVNQRFDEYGNVIPKFVKRILDGQPLTVFGDGKQTRDFVNVADVVQANVLAARSKGVSGTFNVASGSRITINALVAILQEVADGPVEADHAPPRPGDVRHSLADIRAASEAFGYEPKVALKDGLAEYYAWARKVGL